MEYRLLKNLVEYLKKSDKKIMFAESVTAGMVSSDFAGVPGVSSVLLGSVVTYSPELKTKVLKVNKSLIKKYSAESKEVTEAMALGLIKKFNPNIAVAVTGAASHPVNDYQVVVNTGTIFVCIIVDGKPYHFNEVLNGGRNEVRQKAVDFIFGKLIEILEVKDGTE